MPDKGWFLDRVFNLNVVVAGGRNNLIMSTTTLRVYV